MHFQATLLLAGFHMSQPLFTIPAQICTVPHYRTPTLHRYVLYPHLLQKTKPPRTIARLPQASSCAFKAAPHKHTQTQPDPSPDLSIIPPCSVARQAPSYTSSHVAVGFTPKATSAHRREARLGPESSPMPVPSSDCRGQE